MAGRTGFVVFFLQAGAGVSVKLFKEKTWCKCTMVYILLYSRIYIAGKELYSIYKYIFDIVLCKFRILQIVLTIHTKNCKQGKSTEKKRPRKPPTTVSMPRHACLAYVSSSKRNFWVPMAKYAKTCKNHLFTCLAQREKSSH